jgi:hypothetical protein
MQTINTRQDLDALVGTPEHAAFIDALKASLTRTQDSQEYPENYNRDLKPGDVGYLPPIWAEVTDASIAARYGFTPEELTLPSAPLS